jgi:hypothetical protein
LHFSGCVGGSRQRVHELRDALALPVQFFFERVHCVGGLGSAMRGLASQAFKRGEVT